VRVGVPKALVESRDNVEVLLAGLVINQRLPLDRTADRIRGDRPPASGLCSRETSSRVLRARRASPAEREAMKTISSSPSSTTPRSPFGLSRARRRIAAKSRGARGFNAYTLTRDRSAELISKEGFSVVAPIRVMSPDSTKGRNASCWARLNR